MNIPVTNDNRIKPQKYNERYLIYFHDENARNSVNLSYPDLKDYPFRVLGPNPNPKPLYNKINVLLIQFGEHASALL